MEHPRCPRGSILSGGYAMLPLQLLLKVCDHCIHWAKGATGAEKKPQTPIKRKNLRGEARAREMAVGQNQWDPILVGRCTAHFTLFYWGSLGVRDFDPWPNQAWARLLGVGTLLGGWAEQSSLDKPKWLECLVLELCSLLLSAGLDDSV